MRACPPRRILDDVYLACELDCNASAVGTMIDYLEAAAEDFKEVSSHINRPDRPSRLD